MSQQTRVVLISPHDVAIEPPTNRIHRPHWEPGNLPERDIDLREFTHWALAANAGRVSSDVLLNAAETTHPPVVSVLPLEGCEWNSVFSDALYRMSHILLKCAVIVCPMLPRENKSTSYFTHESDLRLMPSESPVGQLLRPFRLPLLCPPSNAQKSCPLQLSSGLVVENILKNPGPFCAYCAGLALMDDNLELGHDLAQSIEGHPDGDYWHAIMHRREPDYGNSKYWFRHVGRHPVFAPLASRAAEIMNDATTDVGSRWASRLKLDAGWDPFAFVDMCEAAASDEESDLGLTARRIQWSEMLLLLRHCAQTK
jgi:hypothetical protein